MGASVSLGMAAPAALGSNRSSISWGLGGGCMPTHSYGDARKIEESIPETADTRREFSGRMDAEEDLDEEDETQDLTISFEYQCRRTVTPILEISSADERIPAGLPRAYSDSPPPKPRRSSSFSCFSGAAIGANVTLANTTINNNTIGGIVLPGLDSPRAFRTLNSSFSRSTSCSGSSYGVLGGTSLSSSASPPMLQMSPSVLVPGLESPPTTAKLSASAPEMSVLEPCEVRTAGGPAGEDRLQVICSEENAWLYCAVYDGFNGRDAADYLAAHLYECIVLHLRLLEWQASEAQQALEGSREGEKSESRSMLIKVGQGTAAWDFGSKAGSAVSRVTAYRDIAGRSAAAGSAPERTAAAPARVRVVSSLAVEGPPGEAACLSDENTSSKTDASSPSADEGDDGEAFRQAVTCGLRRAVAQTESDFLDMVEQEMDERPDLAMIGSCVLAVLLHGQDLYTVNLGDSRAVLATQKAPSGEPTGMPAGHSLYAIQLTEDHSVSNEKERLRVIQEHPEDPHAVTGTRVKGKLRVTRAFGAGYLKHARFNNALLGILRVRDLDSPPYVSAKPYVSSRRVQPEDRFVVVASDGLFDFFTNEEVVSFVWHFVSQHPKGDPAKFMLEQMLLRAAKHAGLTVDELRSIPIGRRRKYHDDVTIVVVTLGNTLKTTSASTLL